MKVNDGEPGVAGESIVLEVETTTRWKCEECDGIFDLEQVQENGSLYECGNCNERYNRSNSANDNHQCPSCNKFGAKVAAESCPDCAGGEVTEIDGFYCPCPNCTEFHEEGDWNPTEGE